MKDVLAAEWLKIRTARSSRHVLFAVAGTAVLGMLLAYAWGQTWEGMSPASRSRLTDSSIEGTTAPLLHLCLAAFGVLIITGEYSSGLIRTTLTVAPRRLAVLVSKATVAGAIASVSGLVVTFSTYLVSRDILSGRGFPGYAASFREELPGLLQASALAGVVALVGLGTGTVLRSTAGALSVVAAWLFIVPALARLLPDPWDEIVGSASLSSHTSPVVLACYAVMALAAAAVSFLRKDV